MKLNKKGFSLIELMVVIAIIGILATAGINMYASYQAKARDSKRITNLNSVIIWLQWYYTTNSEYPEATDSAWAKAATWKCLSTTAWAVHTDLKSFFSDKPVPVDPLVRQTADCATDKSFSYKTLKKDAASGDKSAYILGTNVEDKTNANILYKADDNYAAISLKFNDPTKKITSAERSNTSNLKTAIYAVSE